jgi:hypothetical protein
VIMGNDHEALVRLWREKRGEIEPEDLSDNLIVQLGKVTEDLNRRWYERNTGQAIKDVQRRVQHPVVNAYRLQHRLPDRIIGGVAGQAMDTRMEQFSKAKQVEYFSAWNRSCNSDGCLSRTGLSPSDVVVWDHVHLSKQGSEFLGSAVMNYLLGTTGSAISSRPD